MKKVFVAQNMIDVSLLKTKFDAEGVACIVKNEMLSQSTKPLPFWPELWIVNDNDWDDAQAILKEWQHNLKNKL